MKKLLVATAVGALMVVAGQAAAAEDGAKVYQSTCFACHGTGAAGAPKFGDKAAWAPRIAQGMDVLKEHALKGYQGKTGFMPAKGGFANLSDEAVVAAIEHMVANSK